MTTSSKMRSALGGLIGVVGLIAMIRLVLGAFGGASTLAWFFILCAMIPWVGYAAWRARRSHLTARPGLAVGVLGLVGLLTVWLSTLGPVIALACSFAAFVVIWVHDLPPRRGRSEEFVRIEDLAFDESGAARSTQPGGVPDPDQG
jgi:NAD/NADP transhydrogenase beta subunit